MGKWDVKTIGEVNCYKSKSINPINTPNTMYELYSVPSWDNKYPEIIKGSDIGSTKQTAEKGDVLLCKINPRINRVWVVEQYTDYPVIASSEWIIIRNQEISSHYLAWYLRSPKFRDMMISEQSGIGGSLTRAQPKRVNNYPVLLPSLPVQHKIADALDRASTLIEKRKAQIEKLDLLVKSQFIEMFGDPVTNPKGWKSHTVSDLCDDILGGGTPSKSHPEYFTGSIPWISPKDMKSAYIADSIDHITEEAVQNSTTNLVPKNSILMVIRSGILKRHLPVAINVVPVTINQDMKAFIPSALVVSQYLMYYFKLIEHDVLSGVRAVTADNIDFNDFKKRVVVVPPIELQNKFSVFVEQVEGQKKLLQQSLAKLELNYKSLMQKCFRGEIF